MFELRMIPMWNSFTLFIPITFVSPTVNTCARPIVRRRSPVRWRRPGRWDTDYPNGSRRRNSMRKSAPTWCWHRFARSLCHPARSGQKPKWRKYCPWVLLGVGMYCSKFLAGADHALIGIMAFGSTHWAVVVQPGLAGEPGLPGDGGTAATGAK